jgi:hypothetical protein
MVFPRFGGIRNGLAATPATKVKGIGIGTAGSREVLIADSA